MLLQSVEGGLHNCSYPYSLSAWAPTTVETDTLDYAIASILSITCSDGEIRPVAFYSRTLTAPKLNYNTHDKELLAIFEAFKTW